MKRIKSLLRGNIRQYAMVIALIVVVVIFEVLTKGVLLKPLNISNLIQQNAYVLILAMRWRSIAAFRWCCSSLWLWY